MEDNPQNFEQGIPLFHRNMLMEGRGGGSEEEATCLLFLILVSLQIPRCKYI